MRFIFPFSEIKQNSKIVLYGASECGYDFYRQIVSTGYCEIVLWVDRQYEWWRYMGLPVEPPEKLCDVNYDVVVSTAEREAVHQSIVEDMMVMGVAEETVFWKRDYRIRGNIALRYLWETPSSIPVLTTSSSAFFGLVDNLLPLW